MTKHVGQFDKVDRDPNESGDVAQVSGEVRRHDTDGKLNGADLFDMAEYRLVQEEALRKLDPQNVTLEMIGRSGFAAIRRFVDDFNKNPKGVYIYNSTGRKVKFYVFPNERGHLFINTDGSLGYHHNFRSHLIYPISLNPITDGVISSTNAVLDSDSHKVADTEVDPSGKRMSVDESAIIHDQDTVKSPPQEMDKSARAISNNEAHLTSGMSVDIKFLVARLEMLIPNIERLIKQNNIFEFEILLHEVAQMEQLLIDLSTRISPELQEQAEILINDDRLNKIRGISTSFTSLEAKLPSLILHIGDFYRARLSRVISATTQAEKFAFINNFLRTRGQLTENEYDLFFLLKESRLMPPEKYQNVVQLSKELWNFISPETESPLSIQKK